MPKMEGFVEAGKYFAKKTINNVDLKVGYSADYALFVHENLAIIHPNGQAKFIETPMVQYRKVMQGIIITNLKAGKSLQESLRLAGEFLLRESQKLVPVRTGHLRDSGYVQVVTK